MATRFLATARTRRISGWVAAIAFGVPVIGGFVLHSLTIGIAGAAPPWPDSYLFVESGHLVNTVIALHMLLGAAAMVLIPLQPIASIRDRWPAAHRIGGRLIVAGALVAAVGGLIYIAARGTKGGWPMDVGFVLYGALMWLCAIETARHARARRIARHRRWALRLLVLVMGSLLYRLHYVVWYLATDGRWSELPAHTGAFDLVQNFAFYVPYLLLLEWWFRRERPEHGGEGTRPV